MATILATSHPFINYKFSKIFARSTFARTVLNFVVSDDERSDHQSKYAGYVRVFLHAVDRRHRGGRNSYVTRQQLRPVRLSHLAHKAAALGVSDLINLQHAAHGFGSLHRSHVSNLVQECKKFELLVSF